MARPGDYIELSRPFTLLPPFVGFVCFALVAVGVSGGIGIVNLNIVLDIVLGALAAMILNA
ncbi:MAG: hypothetical protein DRH44_06595, partial [Candidatus Coatesbacteria bacterium]